MQVHNSTGCYCFTYQNRASHCLPHCYRYPWRLCHWHHWCMSHRQTPADRKSITKGQRRIRANNQNEKDANSKSVVLQPLKWRCVYFQNLGIQRFSVSRLSYIYLRSSVEDLMAEVGYFHKYIFISVYNKNNYWLWIILECAFRYISSYIPTASM